MENTATVLYPAASQLGESPMWHPERQSCFWVDIEQGNLYELKWRDKKLHHWHFPQRISLVVVAKNNQVIIALQGGIFKFDPDTATLELLTDLNQNWQQQPFNDGGCDSMGRLWVGTIQLDYHTGNGSLYCIHPNNSFETKIEQLAISNGSTWSADQKKMYHTDNLTRQIRCFHFSPLTGYILFEKVAISIPEQLGLPDGIAMDHAGCLWVALWGGYGVGRWDLNTGAMIEFIPVPAPHVTSCAFVGEQLEALIITTAKEGLDEKTLAQYPESGHVFIVKPGVKGAHVFAADL